MMNKNTIFIINLLIVFFIMFVFALGASRNNKSEDNVQITAYESCDHIAATLSANVPTNTNTKLNIMKTADQKASSCRNLSENDKLMLAKIVMAEAEGEGEGSDVKVSIILTILNRVESDDFPDTIEEVIFENDKNTYQFSPVAKNGRYWTTEPNEECWEAVEIVDNMENDLTGGALYFEACADSDNWHSRNLEFLFKLGGTRFYK